MIENILIGVLCVAVGIWLLVMWNVRHTVVEIGRFYLVIHSPLYSHILDVEDITKVEAEAVDGCVHLRLVYRGTLHRYLLGGVPSSELGELRSRLVVRDKWLEFEN